MNFQRKANIPFEAIFSDEFGIPEFEHFHLQIGRDLSFI